MMVDDHFQAVEVETWVEPASTRWVIKSWSWWQWLWIIDEDGDGENCGNDHDHENIILGVMRHENRSMRMMLIMEQHCMINEPCWWYSSALNPPSFTFLDSFKGLRGRVGGRPFRQVAPLSSVLGENRVKMGWNSKSLGSISGKN